MDEKLVYRCKLKGSLNYIQVEKQGLSSLNEFVYRFCVRKTTCIRDNKLHAHTENDEGLLFIFCLVNSNDDERLHCCCFCQVFMLFRMYLFARIFFFEYVKTK